MLQQSDKKLFDFYNEHKRGKLFIEHQWNENVSSASITLEDLYNMFKIIYFNQK